LAQVACGCNHNLIDKYWKSFGII